MRRTALMLTTDVDRKQAVITTLTTLIGSHYTSRRLFSLFHLSVRCVYVIIAPSRKQMIHNLRADRKSVV